MLTFVFYVIIHYFFACHALWYNQENRLLPSQPLLKCIQTKLHSLKQEIEESREICKVLKDEALTAFEGGPNRIKSFLRAEHPKV